MFLGKILIFLPTLNAIIAPPIDLENEARNFNEWREMRDKFYYITDHPFGWPKFNCGDIVGPQSLLNYEETIPNSVHELHPSQIKVIAALGDSITVGEAEKSTGLTNMLKKYPGVSFVTGSDVSLSKQATLFNIFRKFSPGLKGGSSDRILKFYDFNFAVAGSYSVNLPKQAANLAESLKHKLGERNENTWKFINIFIGHNDLCQVCKNETVYGSEAFGISFKTALSIIKEQIPKVFVNIMPPVNVYLHKENQKVSKFCETSHRLLCPCLFEMESTDYQKQKMKFDKKLKEVVDSFEPSDDLAIVISPAMDLSEILKINGSPNVALIAIDCFHLSTIGHDIAAKQVWKGLFEPVGNKTTLNQNTAEFTRFACPPPKCPYLRTSLNSKQCSPPEISFQNRNMMIHNRVQSTISGTGNILMISGMFIFATVLIFLFVRSSFRQRSDANFDDAERQRLLLHHLPIRADLNDSIF